MTARYPDGMIWYAGIKEAAAMGRMFPLVTFVAGAACGALVTWWALRSDQPPAGTSTITEKAADAARVERAEPSVIAPAGEAPPVREAAMPARSAPPAPAPGFAELSAQLAQMKDAGASGRDIRLILEQLAALGTPEAVGRILEAMEDPDLVFPHRAMDFCEVLSGIDDARIQPAAMRVLDRNLANGLDSGPYTNGYVNLIAAKGGRVASEKMLELLQVGGGAAHDAARAVAALDDRTLGPEFLNIVRSSQHHVDSQLVAGLAEWKDPATTAALRAIAADPAVAEMVRQDTIEALGRNAGAADISAFVNDYSSRLEGDRALAMRGIYGLASNDGIDAAARRAELGPILQEALRSTDASVFTDARYSVEYNDAFHTEEYLQYVQGLLAQETDVERKGGLIQIIEKIKADL